MHSTVASIYFESGDFQIVSRQPQIRDKTVVFENSFFVMAVSMYHSNASTIFLDHEKASLEQIRKQMAVQASMGRENESFEENEKEQMTLANMEESKSR